MECINPITFAMDELAVSRKQLAEISGVSITTIEYLESGSYGTIPFEIIQIIQPVMPSDRNWTIQGEYDRWKMNKLMNSSLPSVLTDGYPQLGDIMHPHTEWREAECLLSLNEYAGTLCVPRFVIQKYESGNQRKFPKNLFVSLDIACGYNIASRIRQACEYYTDDKFSGTKTSLPPVGD